MSTLENEPTHGGVRSRIERAFAATAAAFGFREARQFGAELLIFGALLIAAGAWGVFQFSHFDLLRLCRGFDLWFDSDPARTVANITSRWVIFHERSVLHPLYSLLIAAPFGALQTVTGMPTSELTALYVAVQARPMRCYAALGSCASMPSSASSCFVPLPRRSIGSGSPNGSHWVRPR
jgi:hypothetical protein